MILEPGKTIGVLGGGQLGRMFTHAAQALGYRVHIYEPSGPSPAGAAADAETNAPYEDAEALAAFARSVDIVTYEFENIPVEPLEAIAGLVELRPGPGILHICQNRRREKAWLRREGVPHAAYAEALEGDVAAAVAQVGLPCVVKTADFGYDGKGQMKVENAGDLERAAAIFRGRRCVVERWVDFACEISVVCARSASGEYRAFPVAENSHARHILDTTLVPARVGADVSARAQDLARALAEGLGLVGLLAVEFFVDRSGDVLVNEMAPRPHNSGHWSIDGAETSQFEQQVRAVCGLPLGDPALRSPTVMVNILGDAWKRGKDGEIAAPDWSVILAEPRARLHLYGKGEPRPGRKMGHFTVRDSEPDRALERARALGARLAGA